jgi:hypothetical protein
VGLVYALLRTSIAKSVAVRGLEHDGRGDKIV